MLCPSQSTVPLRVSQCCTLGTKTLHNFGTAGCRLPLPHIGPISPISPIHIISPPQSSQLLPSTILVPVPLPIGPISPICSIHLISPQSVHSYNII